MDAKPHLDPYARQLLICVGPYCEADGMTPAAVRALGEGLLQAGLLEPSPSRVKPTRAHCLGACGNGPVLCVQPEGIWYFGVRVRDFDRVIHDHLCGGIPVEDLVFHRAGQPASASAP